MIVLTFSAASLYPTKVERKLPSLYVCLHFALSFRICMQNKYLCTMIVGVWSNRTVYLVFENHFIHTQYTIIAAMRPSSVEKYLKKSLSDLQISYADLYLIHCPFGVPDTDGDFQREPNGDLVLDTETDHVATWKVSQNWHVCNSNNKHKNVLWNFLSRLIYLAIE